MHPALQRAVEKALGSRIQDVSPISGGDINQAHAIHLEDGRAVFLKSNPAAPPALFSTEAAGLGWLAESHTVATPEVLAFSPVGCPPREAFLALELLSPGPAVSDFDHRLGHQLAALHRASPPSFGGEQNNFIGTLPQANPPGDRWGPFYRDARLAPQLERAFAQGFFDASERRLWDRLLHTLEAHLGPEEPPARLHGDLWGGNLMVNAEGLPTLIDPAVYGGHREMDLAMMKLFGGFGPRVFDAYEDAFPLAPGHKDRVPLYQLSPLLVHVNLFGSAYVPRAMTALNHYL